MAVARRLCRPAVQSRSDRSEAERVRSRTALTHSAVGSAEDLWSGALGWWKATCSFQVVVKDPVDNPERVGPLLGCDLAED